MASSLQISHHDEISSSVNVGFGAPLRTLTFRDDDGWKVGVDGKFVAAVSDLKGVVVTGNEVIGADGKTKAS